ncbi:MAG TPA: aminotransferase class III-fold pyridoxal phosphate-dependent enzyme [Chthonomonadales bacterium]|nr:aminotransferase class III-fold pyridoxal phosphate-dependent enzyme [Chthonomonadales bacterium]
MTEAGQGVDAWIGAVIERYQRHVNPGLASLMKFGGFGDVEVSAEGCVVRTASGAEYLDFLGGYGVFTVGHRHPAVVAAVHAQLDRIPISTRTFFNAPMADLAERLASIAPGDLRFTFFCNSGTEAVEGAVKMVRIASGKPNVVCTVGAFHGKTMGALSATGREAYRKPFEPLVPGFHHVPWDDADALAAAVDDQTAAVIVEPIQGEGGINCPSPGYLQAVRRICSERGAYLIVDEVQTGLGRTGAMFAVDHEGVVPDVMTLAKALGGGVMPIGAVMGTPHIWEKTFGANPLIHTSTFGGNPLACAAGLATVEVIVREGLAERARVLGARLMEGLRAVQREHPGALVSVRGQGLMIGVEFEVEDYAELTINGMARRGIIAAYTLNNPRVIRFEPPLVVTDEQVDRAIGAFRESVAEAVEMLSDV